MACKVILAPKTIGIIGGGQLGQMLSFSAKQMGYKVVILDPQENPPAAQVSDIHIRTEYDDVEGLQQLYDLSDVITYEFENIAYKPLEAFVGKIPQGIFPLKFTQDRLLEKKTIEDAGFKTVPYIQIDSKEEYMNVSDKIGFPSILKARRGGYDGKMQQRIDCKENLKEIHSPSILEKLIDIKQEASLIVTRSVDKSIELFPVIDNIHVSQRLTESSIPSDLPKEVIDEINNIGRSFVEKIDLVGTLAIEFFVTKNNEVIINECAPRVHNSGHLTLESCSVSQFEQHIRSIVGLPLKNVKMNHHALMVNIYGQDFIEALDFLQDDKNVDFHLYGKQVMKRNRKIGHMTFCSNNVILREKYRVMLRKILNKDV